MAKESEFELIKHVSTIIINKKKRKRGDNNEIMNAINKTFDFRITYLEKQKKMKFCYRIESIVIIDIDTA